MLILAFLVLVVLGILVAAVIYVHFIFDKLPSPSPPTNETWPPHLTPYYGERKDEG